MEINTQRNTHLKNEAIRLVEQCINADNLLFAFIAGSRAAQSFAHNSDVDFFVVVKQSTWQQESALATAMADFHAKYQLKYSHCGQILDQATLDSIIANTQHAAYLLEHGFTHLACYQTDCVLSVVRKTMVVLHMLSQAKTDVIGDDDALAGYVSTADAFFNRCGQPPVQQFTNSNPWQSDDKTHSPEQQLWQLYMADIRQAHYLNTPLGVNLGRWFGSPLALQQSDFQHSFTHSGGKTCPLMEAPVSKPCKTTIRRQCLGSVEGVNIEH